MEQKVWNKKSVPNFLFQFSWNIFSGTKNLFQEFCSMLCLTHRKISAVYNGKMLEKAIFTWIEQYLPKQVIPFAEKM